MSFAPIKVCPNRGCYMVNPSAKRVCDNCGYVFYPSKAKPK